MAASDETEENVLWHADVNIYGLDPGTQQYAFSGRGIAAVVWNPFDGKHQIVCRHAGAESAVASLAPWAAQGGLFGVDFTVNTRAGPDGGEWHYFNLTADGGAQLSLQFDDQSTGFHFATHVALAAYEALGKDELVCIDLKQGNQDEEALADGHFAKVGYVVWRVQKTGRVLRCLKTAELDNTFQKPAVCRLGDSSQWPPAHRAVGEALLGMRKKGRRVAVAPVSMVAGMQGDGVAALWVEVERTKTDADPPRWATRGRSDTAVTITQVTTPAPAPLDPAAALASEAALRRQVSSATVGKQTSFAAAARASPEDGGEAEVERRERALLKVRRMVSGGAAAGSSLTSSNATPGLQPTSPGRASAPSSDGGGEVTDDPLQLPPSAPMSPTPEAPEEAAEAEEEAAPPAADVIISAAPAARVVSAVNRESPDAPPSSAPPAPRPEVSYVAPAPPPAPHVSAESIPDGDVTPARRKQKERKRGSKRATLSGHIDPDLLASRETIGDDGEGATERESLVPQRPAQWREWEMCCGNGAFPVNTDAMDPEIPNTLWRASGVVASVSAGMVHPISAAVRILSAVAAAAIAVKLLFDDSDDVSTGDPQGPVVILVGAALAVAVDGGMLHRRAAALRCVSAACAHRCAVLGIGDGIPDSGDLLASPASAIFSVCVSVLAVALALAGGAVAAARSGDGALYAVARLLVYFALAAAVEAAVLLFRATGSVHLHLLNEAVPPLARTRQGRIGLATGCNGRSWTQSLVVRWAAARQLMKEAASVWQHLLALATAVLAAALGWGLWWTIKKDAPSSSAVPPLLVCFGVSLRMAHFCSALLGWREANNRALESLLQHFEWRQGTEAIEVRLGQGAGALDGWHATLAYFTAATHDAPAVWKVGPGEPPRWLVRTLLALFVLSAVAAGCFFAASVTD
eukprot:TRINITY_DN5628_c1_g1_i1.p1 TRINITY_DN5628_c1_g1~~TRINITY_DN5628_c1_g1_i1.p1  ORF type:complete len:919 (+),score=280.67 TRINITY_DN5628_c1_g1_i1:70-2826(+)